MKDIIRYCEQEIPAAAKASDLDAMFQPNVSFWECLPLAIAGDASLKGHKPPFDQSQCIAAMASKGMYEASMNLHWLTPFPSGTTSEQIMGDVPTLADVKAGADSWFDHSADLDLASPQDHTRKVVPAVLAAYVDSAEALHHNNFKQKLQMLDGHIFAWAWWFRLYRILEDFGSPEVDDKAADTFRLHIEIGLSVTVHVRVEKDAAKLAKWAMERGSQRSVANSVVETDSFAAFVKRANVSCKTSTRRSDTNTFETQMCNMPARL